MQRRSLVLAGAALALARRPVRAAGAPLVIGQSVALSGPLAASGRSYGAGATLAFSALDERGGIDGRPLRWVRLDDAGDPARARANLRRLAADPQALALFGGFGSLGPDEIGPLLQDSGLPALGGARVADSVRARCGDAGFFVRASHAQEAAALARHLASLGLQRVAIAHLATPFGQEGLKLVADALARQGLQLAGSAALTSDAATAQEASRKLLAMAPAPQAIVLFTGGAQAAAMMAAAASLRRQPPFFGLSVVGDEDLPRQIGAPARGLVITQPVPSPWKEHGRLMEDYRSRAQAAGVTLGYASLAGWIDAQVMIEALRRCNGLLTRTHLTNSLRLLQMQLASMRIDFSRHEGGGSRYVELVQISESGRYLG